MIMLEINVLNLHILDGIIVVKHSTWRRHTVIDYVWYIIQSEIGCEKEKVEKEKGEKIRFGEFLMEKLHTQIKSE